MADHLNNVAQLVSELFNHGIRHVVISPGSRSAPLTIMFSKIETVSKYVIVDERVAAFFALGMSQQLRIPVALICTSGTATLNYAPALAEAFYAQVPLLAITADRPLYWLNNAEGQQINQTEVFKNFVAGSFTYDTSLPSEKTASVVPQAFELMSAFSRPVHINVPMDEPLYSPEPMELTLAPIIQSASRSFTNALKTLPQPVNRIGSCQKVMIVVGNRLPDYALNNELEKFTNSENVVIICESLSNITAKGVFRMPDFLIPSIPDNELADFCPDLLITISTNLISKHLKNFLRKNKPTEHVHIDAHGYFPDTFCSLTHSLKAKPVEILSLMAKQLNSGIKSNYRSSWKKLFDGISTHLVQTKTLLPWSELKAFSMIHSYLPKGSLLHLGNSLPVRYAQYVEIREDISYFSNRGTSGIDGSLSTAVGASVANSTAATIILGDLSFMYDSNGLWQESLPENLKIVVLNNGGGGIFRVINGPNRFEGVERYFQTRHNMHFRHIAEHYNLPYHLVSTENELNEVLPVFYGTNGTGILEISTDWQLNGNAMKDYIHSIINQV
jgi:2-succinyl-5-enolpyruvyl-6-hydroxy-3-cyclohexene-1-carboxylate synthase